MAKKLSNETQEIISKYGLTEDDLWDCHGHWIVYHKALERIAAKNGITFSQPTIICSDMEKKHAAMLVTGSMGEVSEWSIGEAAPYNSKIAYPFSMAEKRAKDRVILKLLGLHGYVYSEEESDDFKDDAKKDFGPAPVEGDRMSEDTGQKKKSVYQLKKEGAWEQIVKEMNDCHNEAELTAWKNEEKAKGRFADWPDTYSKSLHDEYVKRIKDFRELAKEAAE